MTSNLLISVIIPTCNRALFISDAISSCRRQDYPNVEIIVVDDGSTDNTEAIVRSLQSEDNRLVYIRQDNKGPAAARNNGLRQCNGEFVCFLDSDDYLEPWGISKRVEAFHSTKCREHNVGAVFGDYFRLTSHGKIQPNTFLENADFFEKFKEYTAWENDNLIGFNENIHELQPLYCVINTPTVMIRRQVVKKVGYFNEEFLACQDLDYFLRVSKATSVACLKHPPLANVRYYIEGVTSHKTKALFYGLKILERELKIADSHYKKSLRSAIRNKRKALVYGYYKSNQKIKAIKLLCHHIAKGNITIRNLIFLTFLLLPHKIANKLKSMNPYKGKPFN